MNENVVLCQQKRGEKTFCFFQNIFSILFALHGKSLRRTCFFAMTLFPFDLTEKPKAETGKELPFSRCDK